MDLLTGLKKIAVSREKRLVNIADLSDGFRGLLIYLGQLEDKQKKLAGSVNSLSISSTSTQVVDQISPLLLMGA